MKKLAATKALTEIRPERFDAIYLVGGAGAAYDFPNQGALGALVSSVFARGAPVAAVCHGVLGLVGAKDGSGAQLVAKRKVTGVSNAEETTVQYDKVLPILPEPTLTKLGGVYSAAQPFGEHVVRDGNLLTGQNPASAEPLAREVLRSLGAG
jgi:putative intracellular protease/amidase